MAAATEVRPSFGEWLLALLTANPLRAAVEGKILPLLLWTVACALLVNRIPATRRRPVVRVVRALASWCLTVASWVLWFTPLVVFVLALAFARQAGIEAAGVIGYYVLTVALLLLAGTAAIYVLVAVGGGTSPRRFARAVAPAQALAISTRSSLACFPALLRAANRLGLPPAVTGFVLPLTASIFKAHRTMFSVYKMLFLAALYGVTIGTVELVGFALTITVLSFAAVGIPGGGYGFKSLPAYVVLGIPIEGYLLVRAVDQIPDIFKTLINVTGDLAVTTVIARWVSSPATPAADEPEMDLPERSPP